MHCNAYRLQKLWLFLIWAQVGGGINYDVTARGKRSLAIDLKHPEGFKVMQKLCETADVLIEPFRPGVMERLGFGGSFSLLLFHLRRVNFHSKGPKF